MGRFTHSPPRRAEDPQGMQAGHPLTDFYFAFRILHSAIPTHPHDTRVSMKTSLLPPLPPSLHSRPKPAAEPPAEKSQSVIVPIKIPPPMPPSALRKPTAATSNVALTKDTTQTLRPVPPEGPNAAKNETKGSPAQKGSDSENHEEPS
jgi:hypothetical protein